MKNKHVKELMEHGKSMIANGWKVEASNDPDTELYRWLSPRGQEFFSSTINVPPETAVDDATSNDDYPHTT